MKSKILGLVAVGLLAAPAASMAELIDFESIKCTASPGNEYVLLNGYDQGGYQLVSSTNTFNSICSGNSDPFFAGFYAGSAALYNNVQNATTTLLSTTGVFDLYSIDLAPASVQTHGGGAQVTFTGLLAGGGTVSQTFQVGNSMAFQTFLFSGFQNLTYVIWTQVSPYHQYDNICIGDSSCTQVPEPGTLALLGLGLAGLGLSRRRKA